MSRSKSSKSPREALSSFEERLAPREVPRLLELFTSPDYFGVETATEVQRAICEGADGGAPWAYAGPHMGAFVSWTDRGALDTSRPWGGVPKQLAILAGARCGKTRLAAAASIRMALSADLSGLAPGEVARIPIVSLTLDLAAAAFGQLSGTCLDRPKLRKLLLEEPTGGRVLLRHPTGRPVEIVVSAGKRAGSSLIARWLAGAIFDEAPRMLGSEDGAIVNLDDSLAAIQSRVRPGGQIILIGTPWAPVGPVYRMVQERHGKPGKDILVVRAKAQWMNPGWWTDARVHELRTSSDVAKQISYRTDCEAEWIDPEAGLITSSEIDGCTRHESVLPSHRADGVIYCAAIDPAARLNAWTLVVKCTENRVDRIALAKQWHRPPGGDALDPDRVLGEIARDVAPYGITMIATDKWQVDTLKSLARRHGLDLVEYDYAGLDLAAIYLEMQAKIAQRLVELPPDPVLRADLLAMRRRVSSSGMTIELPTTGNGRHCDYAPALARVLRMWVPDCKPQPSPPVDVEKKLLDAAKKKYIKPEKHKNRDLWWQRRLG